MNNLSLISDYHRTWDDVFFVFLRAIQYAEDSCNEGFISAPVAKILSRSDEKVWNRLIEYKIVQVLPNGDFSIYNFLQWRQNKINLQQKKSYLKCER